MILSCVFVVFILQPATWAKVAALIIFIVAAISDAIDGIWARKQQKISAAGKFLDPLADKMLVNLALFALTYIDVVPLWVFVIILVRDFAIDGLRMIAAQHGLVIAASVYGKLKTIFMMTALIILIVSLIFDVALFVVLGNITLYLALALSIISAIDYFCKSQHINPKHK